MLIYSETPEEYHTKNDLVSFHRMLDYEISPGWFFQRHVARTAPAMEQTDDMLMGSVFHCMALEESKLEDRYSVVPKGTKETSEIWQAAVAEGKQPVRAQIYEAAEKMMDALETNDEALALLAGGHPELTIRHDHFADHVFGVQGRTDYIDLTSHRIVDLKKCADLDKFEREIFNRNYYRQGAFYRMLYELETGFPSSFYLIAAESNVPYRVRIFELDALLLDTGHQTNLAVLKRLDESYRMNRWDLHPEKKTITAPAWLLPPDPFVELLTQDNFAVAQKI